MPLRINGLEIQLLLLLLGIISFQAPLWATQPGDPAPATHLPDMKSGAMVSVSDYQGNVVFIDFWASWCPPCRQSLPLYEAMNKRLEGGQFKILAINLDEDLQDAKQFLKHHPVSFTILMDPAGNSAGDWEVMAMPSSYLVDSSGKVAKIYIGFEPSNIGMIEHDIKMLLDSMPDAGTGNADSVRRGEALGAR